MSYASPPTTIKTEASSPSIITSNPFSQISQSVMNSMNANGGMQQQQQQQLSPSNSSINSMPIKMNNTTLGNPGSFGIGIVSQGNGNGNVEIKKKLISLPPPNVGRDGVGIQVPSMKKNNGRAREGDAANGAGAGGKVGVKRQRKRVNTAEKRASHNAVERQRRETLNSKFLDLARLLPTLANLRRPSKSSIVNGSIHHLTLQREQRLLAARELKSMFGLNQELLEELNEWRGRNGHALKANLSWTEGCEEVISVETEVFGTFTGGMGGDNDDDEGDEQNEMADGEGDNDIDQEEDERLVQQAAMVNNGTTRQSSSSAASGGMLNGLDEASIIAAATAASMGNNNNGNGHNRFVPSFLANGNGSMSFAQQQLLQQQQQEQFGAAVMSFNNGNEQGRTMSFASTLVESPTFGSFNRDSGIELSQNQINAFLSEQYEHNSSGSPLGGSMNGSNADVVTPPPNFNLEQGPTQIATFMDSPPAGVAATSFALGNGSGGDKVSDWAAQQMMLQLGASGQFGNAQMMTNRMNNCFEGGRFVGGPNGIQYNRSYSNGNIQSGFEGSTFGNPLNAAHQTLLANQPHMAAAVFPPASSGSPPFIKPSSRNGLNGSTRNENLQQQQAQPAQNALHAAAEAQILQAAAGLNLSADRIEEWKRFAMGAFLAQQAQNQSNNMASAATNNNSNMNQSQAGGGPSMLELREAVRAGMTVGMGLAQGNWNTSPMA